MTSEEFFTGDETISDILLQLPDAADILMSHGLACVGCHINVFETLRGGMSMHGMDESHLTLILADLNEAAADNGLHEMSQGSRPLRITGDAAVAIKEFQDDAGIHGWGITITNDPENGFEIDFAEKAGAQDMDMSINGIRCFLAPEVYKALVNNVLDFEEGGFSIAHRE